MNARAVHKYLRISPTKARQVVDLIRNKPLNDALVTLRLMSKRAAGMVDRAVRSAWANAQEKDPGAEGEAFYVSEAKVDQGPTLRRWRPRAMGRVNRIRRRTCYITIVLSDRQDEDARGTE